MMFVIGMGFIEDDARRSLALSGMDIITKYIRLKPLISSVRPGLAALSWDNINILSHHEEKQFLKNVLILKAVMRCVNHEAMESMQITIHSSRGSYVCVHVRLLEGSVGFYCQLHLKELLLLDRVQYLQVMRRMINPSSA